MKLIRHLVALILTNVGNNPQLDANLFPEPASQCRDTVEWSPDLAIWQPFGTGTTNGAGILQLTDTTTAGQPKRFYRAIIE